MGTNNPKLPIMSAYGWGLGDAVAKKGHRWWAWDQGGEGGGGKEITGD